MDVHQRQRQKLIRLQQPPRLGPDGARHRVRIRQGQAVRDPDGLLPHIEEHLVGLEKLRAVRPAQLRRINLEREVRVKISGRDGIHFLAANRKVRQRHAAGGAQGFEVP